MIKRIQREEEETSGLQWWELGGPAVGLSSCRLNITLILRDFYQEYYNTELADLRQALILG